MNALQAMKWQLNFTHTENCDLAYKSTGSACLDFFSLCGGMRKNLSDLDKIFARAYAENPVVAVKILFYMRNIRGGLGERSSFRVLLKELAKFYPETAKKIVYAVPEYGRWDDLLVLLDTPVKEDVVAHPDGIFRRKKDWDSDMEKMSLSIIKTARETNVVLEDNLTSRLVKGKLFYRPEFWKLCEEQGDIKTITGLDAHSPAFINEVWKQKCKLTESYY